jgi:uncharacterized protein
MHMMFKIALASCCILAAMPANAGGSQAKGAPREVTVAGPQGPLAGTMIELGKKTPIVIIIPGSGPTDRDGNNPMGVAAASYRLLSEALATQGISSLRADKRGMFASKMAIADANKVRIADYAADANNWIAMIRKQSGRKCVWLIGHSEGGLVALATVQNRPDICGVIALATPGRKLAEVMREQLEQNPANAPILPDALYAITELENGRQIDVSKMHPALQGLFNPAVQPFLIDLFSYDPARLAAAIKQPMLVISGGRDLQVAQSDADVLVKANPNATLVTIVDMNHVLKSVSTDGKAANMSTYADPSIPVNPGLVRAITDFVLPRRLK